MEVTFVILPWHCARLAGVCTQVSPESPASPDCTYKSDFGDLIPEFFWLCRSLLTKLLGLSSQTLPPSGSLRVCLMCSGRSWHH